MRARSLATASSTVQHLHGDGKAQQSSRQQGGGMQQLQRHAVTDPLLLRYACASMPPPVIGCTRGTREA